jgi:hypothetical protein
MVQEKKGNGNTLTLKMALEILVGMLEYFQQSALLITESRCNTHTCVSLLL